MSYPSKELFDRISTLPVDRILIETANFQSSYKLIKDGTQCYLLFDNESFLLHNRGFFKSLRVGKYLQDDDLTKWMKGVINPEIVLFTDGSGFILHSVEGPAYFRNDGVFPDYYINGHQLTSSQFTTHPLVMIHKNKLTLKQKLKDLK